MNRLGDNWFVEQIWQVYSLCAMTQHAKGMGLKKGVAFVCVEEKGVGNGICSLNYAAVEGTFTRPSRGGGDKGTNYFGIAMEKLATMKDHLADSGKIGLVLLKNGESPYRGGVIREYGRYFIYVGFSGGTEDEDVEIANVGMRMMLAEVD